MKADYSNTLKAFAGQEPAMILSEMTGRPADESREMDPFTAIWARKLDVLHETIGQLKASRDWQEWQVLIGYPIPWTGRRIDAVILARNLIVVIQVKIGQTMYRHEDIAEIEDDCRRLRDFHEGSRTRTMVPLLIATDAPDTVTHHSKRETQIEQTFLSNRQRLIQILGYIVESYGQLHQAPLVPADWEASAFEPPPNIVEVAQALYAGQAVPDQTQTYPGAIDAAKTVETLSSIVKRAWKNKEKHLCLISGAPGSGKSFVGLRLARRYVTESLFLSGNDNLVRVLQEAVARYLHEEANAVLKESKQAVGEYVQETHQFYETYYGKSLVPECHILVVDDAQRAWSSRQVVKKYARYRSEPEMLLDMIDRRQDWAVVIALVGCGEELERAEGQLPHWGKAIADRAGKWQVTVSPELLNGSLCHQQQSLFDEVESPPAIKTSTDLQLTLSARAYRAEYLNDFVTALMASNPEAAGNILSEHMSGYPIVYSRSLSKAKAWLREHCEGSRRMGLVSSSGAKRLKAYGLEVSNRLKLADWYLLKQNDIRSCSHLEKAATERKAHGLELDWSCVCWGCDLRHDSAAWQYLKLSGSVWENEHDPHAAEHIRNRYRILLSRAREGMVIWVPPGDLDDPTILPAFYDRTADYLASCGIPCLDN